MVIEICEVHTDVVNRKCERCELTYEGPLCEHVFIPILTTSGMIDGENHEFCSRHFMEFCVENDVLFNHCPAPELDLDVNKNG